MAKPKPNPHLKPPAPDQAPTPPAFELANPPPPWRPARFDPILRRRQRKLLSGLKCLPDQADLFPDVDTLN